MSRSNLPRVLNLGCGHKTSPHPDVLNVDWSIFLRFRKSRLLRSLPLALLRGARRQRYVAIPDNTLAHDVARPLPFPDASIDIVYHSHMLEHIARDQVTRFLHEVYRVLRPGGVHRVVVPDLEVLARRYLEHVGECGRNQHERARHEEYVAELIEQCVREIPAGAAALSGWRRRLYLALCGNARTKGEVHRWMYDSVTLTQILTAAGFAEVEVQACDRSRIEDWKVYGLDLNENGTAHKADSLYIECVRPRAG
ncbi:MAG: methyltransferase domain-containing protein [Gammaproteobacteria bacterium]|nr:MAG: methyltransferase domain-containing protein [Gammaproteobacteria bacterium]